MLSFQIPAKYSSNSSILGTSSSCVVLCVSIEHSLFFPKHFINTYFVIIFIRRSLPSLLSFVDAFRECRISSNLNLKILVSSSFFSLIFSMISFSLFSFSSTFSLLVTGSIAFIQIDSGSTSFPSFTFIRLSNELSLWNLEAFSLNVWAPIVEFLYISSHASFILLINPLSRFLSRFHILQSVVSLLSFRLSTCWCCSKLYLLLFQFVPFHVTALHVFTFSSSQVFTFTAFHFTALYVSIAND